MKREKKASKIDSNQKKGRERKRKSKRLMQNKEKKIETKE